MSENTITIMKPLLSDDDVIKGLRKRCSWFSGLIPSRTFRMVDSFDEYVPYIVAEIWYRKGNKKPRRCFLFWNIDNNQRKGVLEDTNVKYIDIETPDDVFEYDYDKEALEAEITSYCKMSMLAKHHRKFIDWDIEIKEIKKIYRLKRIYRYNVNKNFRADEVYLDSFALK